MKTFHFHLSLKSDNQKTGPIPVSTTSENSCPPHCPLAKNGCYLLGPIAWHWAKVSAGLRGTDLDTFCDAIKALPEDTVWRHNQGGDLPGDKNRLDGVKVRKIVKANHGKKAITYTHYPPSVGSNAAIIADANRQGFTVNLSADNLAEADEFKALGIAPVVVIVPEKQTTNFKTPAGNLVVICPYEKEQYRTKGVNCSTCKLCAWSSRDVIVGFPVHGAQKRKAELVAIGA